MHTQRFSTSTATKVLIAITGLSLYAFLIIHLAGNLMVFAGPKTFNAYSHRLISNPLVYLFEVGLASVFLLHIWKAAANFVANRRAKPQRYAKVKSKGRPSKRTVSSRTMIVTGVMLLLFVLVHLKGMKFGAYYAAAEPGVRDVYRLQMSHLSNPLVALFYVVSMVFIGSHLWHGLWSAFQSLGLGGKRITPKLVAAGRVGAVLITAGFIAVAVWTYAVGAPAHFGGK